MQKIYLLILSLLGVLTVLQYESEELGDSEEISKPFSFLSCIGFSATIQSDTIYNCPSNTHIYTIDTSVNNVYQWTGPSGYISSSWEIFVTQRGIYGLTIVDTLNNCTATDSIYVRQYPCEDLSSEWIPPGTDITVYLDTVNPTFTVPIDTTIYTSAFCVASTSSSFTGDVLDETDDCDLSLDVTYQDSVSNDCAGSITIFRTWSVEDQCGNATTQLQTIYVRDSIPPTILTPSDTILYANNQCQVDTSIAVLGNFISVSDGCDLSINSAIYSDSRIDLCLGSYNILRTWTATDVCGNLGSATQIISVVDSSGPTISIPGDTVLTSAGVANNASATDNCVPIPFMSYIDSTAILGCQRHIYRTWTAIDDCGNVSSGTQNIVYDQSYIISPNSSDFNGFDISCPGASDGWISVAVIGASLPISYEWSTGGTFSSISGLVAGNYALTVTDNNGCSDSLNFILSEPNNVQISFASNNPSCYQTSDGLIDVSISGGVSPYSYLWLHDNNTTEDLNNLTSGSYILQVTDANGCIAIDSTSLMDPPLFEIDVVITSDYNGYPTSCIGASNAAAAVQLINNNGNVNYNWSNGQTSDTLINISAGTYYVTVTDLNGCIAIDSVTILDNPGIQPDIQVTSDFNGSPVSCYNSSDASASVSAIGGQGPFNYLWSNGATTSSVMALDTGYHFLTITDANGCSAVDSLLIEYTNATDFQISIDTDYNGNALSCNGATDANISVDVSNGIGPYSFLWSTGSTQDSLIGLPAGVYNLTVTDANGCDGVGFVTIPNPSPIQVDLTTNLLDCGLNNGQILVNASGGSDQFEYSLDNLNWQTNNVFSNLPPGAHTVYIRDIIYGCSATPTATILITATAPSIENITVIHPTQPGLTDGAIMIDISSLGLSVEYRINGITGWQSQNIFSSLGEGTYNVETRYVNQNCLDTASITLIADNGITTIDSSANVCSDELSNIQNLEVYYLPIAEDEILLALQTITPLGCANVYSIDPIQNYIYVGIVESGTIVTYDHWEDGFETNFDFSIQPSTEIWGDGNPNNGMPPGYNLDYFNAGDKIFLNNPVTSTTRASVIDYDAGDRISSRGAISITRLGWATGSSTLFAGAVEVHKTESWGRNYKIPVGQNSDVNNMFGYTGFTVMASSNNTVVQIDADNNGILDGVINLNQGESYLYNGGVFSGGTISASSPVQIHLITGDNCSNYESRWFTLSPEENWDNGYYVPVSTLNNGGSTTNIINKPTYVHLYNPHSSSISVIWRTVTGIQDTIIIASDQTAYQEIPEGSGAHFASEENFYAIATIDSDAGNNTANDWGFALLPERLLSPQIYLTGFAPGQNPGFTCDIGIPIDPNLYTINSVSSEESNSINGLVQNAFDSDLSTGWYSEYSGGINDHPHEIVLDLGQIHNVIGFTHINALSNVLYDNYVSPNPPVVLPNNTLHNTSTAFAITDNFSIIDLNVELDIDHSRINDLTLILESPSGTRVRLFEDQCSSEMDLISTFDDQAASNLDCSNTTSGSYRPKERLSTFNGEYSSGVWTLHIEDDNGILGGGSLNSWSLNFTHGISDNGAIEEYEFYVSDDGINWGVPVGQGTWIDSIPIHDERITPIDARFVRFVSLSDFQGLGIASIGELRILECGSTYSENSSPLWITAGHTTDIDDSTSITVCVDFNGDGGKIIDPTGAQFDSSFVIPPLGLLKIFDPDGDQTGMRVWVCDGSDAIISGAWGQDPAEASPADPAIDLGVGLINSIPYSAQKCVELENDFAGNDLYDRCDEVTYTIIVRNTGALPLSTGTIAIIDTLPSELEYIAGSARAMVDQYTISVFDDTINSTIFPFDEGGTAIDTIILPGDSLLIKFEALIAYVNFGAFITNQAFVTNYNNSFDPYVSFPVQKPINPLDSIVPADTLVSCEAFIYPDASMDTLSYLAIHDTIYQGLCLDAFTFQRIFTFTDNCYNQYIDTMLITVRDTTPPVLVLPADTIISIGDLPYNPSILSSDNCDVDVTITTSDDTTFNVCNYIVERIFYAEDNCSNISQDTLRFTVVFDDQSWPVLINVSDLDPCQNEVVTLTSSIFQGNGRSYFPQWFYRSDTTQNWNSLNGSNQNIYSFTANQGTSGLYQVRYSLDSTGTEVGCAEHTAEVVIQPRPIPSDGNINAVICPGEQYLFFGMAYTQAGSYSQSTSTSNGCDSTVVLNLMLAPQDHTILRDTICFNQPYSFSNQLLTTSGTYYDTLSNSSGCDSIIELQFYVKPQLSNSLELSICSGEVLSYNGKAFSNSGSYNEVFSSSNGCDSIVTLNLLVRAPSQSSSLVDICFGDSILIGSQFVKSSGTYSQSLFDQHGCDSLAVYQVTVDSEPIVENINRVICQGDSVYFDGVYLNSTGIYQNNTSSQISGCDSTTYLNLIVQPVIQLSGNDMTICNGDIVNLNVSGADSVIWSDTEGFSCQTCPDPEVYISQTKSFTATANSCAGTASSVSLTVSVFETPEVEIIRDTTVVLGESIELKAKVSDPFAMTNWYTSESFLLCSDCLSTVVTPEENTFYIVEASNAIGCIDRDSLNVTVRDGCVEGELIIPNYLTPNGDGQNDYFTVQWNGIKSAEKLRIFNRWGELLFSTEEVDKDFWDGTFGGQEVNPGVYVYYVEYYCLNNNLQRHKGNVTVIR